MTQYEKLSVAAAVAGAAINGALFIVFALQLRALRRQVTQSRDSTDLDHTRRRCQATIEFYATTLEKRDELRTVLPYDRDADAIRELLKRATKETDEVGKPVTEYLSLFELLATGVNTEVFDLETIERVAGGRVRAIAKNYQPWIVQRRRQFDSPLLYQEIEILAEKLEDRLAARLAGARARSATTP